MNIKVEVYEYTGETREDIATEYSGRLIDIVTDEGAVTAIICKEDGFLATEYRMHLIKVLKPNDIF